MSRSESEQKCSVELLPAQSDALQTTVLNSDTPNICRYDGRLLRELAAAYNHAIHKIPHCYAVSVRDFQQAIAPASGGAAHPERHDEAIFLALDPGSNQSHAQTGGITGLIHVAIGTSWKNYRAITFYSNFGYQIVDWTYGLARKLE